MSELEAHSIEEPEPKGNMTHQGISLVVAALILPVVAGVAEFFVNTVVLSFAIGGVAVLGSAVLVAVDARNLGKVDRTGKVRMGAGLLFIGMIAMWIVFFPLAFYQRRSFTSPDLFVHSLVVALFFLFGPMAYALLMPQLLPTATSPEVIELLEKVIRDAAPEVKVLSVDGHQEISFDKESEIRRGKCMAHTDKGDFEVFYQVEWQDENKDYFLVRLVAEPE